MTLGKAYDEIMERINVTPEMRRRVLEHIAQKDISPGSSKIVRFPAVKKYLSIAACLILLLVGTTTLPHLLKHPEPDPPVLTVPNIVETASLEELSEMVGFKVTEKFSLPFEAERTAYRSYWNELAEVEYSGGEYTATYRQSLGADDNSGDYDTYSDAAEVSVNDLNVTLQGNGGSYVLATWTDGTYAYSLSISPGASVEAWHTIL